MAFEWFAKPKSGPDESVAALVERHYGAEIVERLADPLLSGFTAVRPRSSECAQSCHALPTWKQNSEA